MNRIADRLLHIASIALLGGHLISRALAAQAPPTEHFTITVTLTVPVQVKDLNPDITKLRVFCRVFSLGGPASISFDGGHNFLDVGPVVNGAYSGTANVVVTGTSTQSIGPQQQVSYQCFAGFLFKGHDSADPDVDHAAFPTLDSENRLAAGSPANQVQGSFTPLVTSPLSAHSPLPPVQTHHP
jgi:hypothetical protein